MNTSIDVDVLVVGAGPTGLTVALELKRRGIKTRLIERRTEPSDKSRALVVHARTLEQLDLVELADELVRQGYTSPGIDFSSSAAKPLRADMHRLAGDTRFPFILILPQAETEAALERRLQAEGCPVERGLELKSFVQTDTHVTATLAHKDGEEQIVTARYLVGADGPHSSVREALGLRFEGSRYRWTAFLGDVKMSGHQAEGGTEQHASDRGLAFIVPFEDGSHRIVTIDSKYQGDAAHRELSLEELQESISAILGEPVQLSEPRWLTRWGSELRLAEAYGSGRIFLAGDAAHTHSPAGGQGMNTGIQDAFNLGWRIALAVDGQAGASLLDAYRQERRAVGQRVLRVSDLLLRSLLLRKTVPRHIREWLFHLLVPIPAVQRRLASNLSGLGVHYGELGRAGMRVPDLLLLDANHQSVRLYELMRHGKPLALLYVDTDEMKDAQAVRDLIGAASRSGAKAYVVLQSGMPEKHEFTGAQTLVDYRGEVNYRLGISKPPHVLVIRPDGYVAWELPKLNAAEFQERYQNWLQGSSFTAPKHRAMPNWAAAAAVALATVGVALYMRKAV